MKETIKKATKQEILGTSFVGYLKATTDAIVKVFGKPHLKGSIDGKTRFEWHLKLVLEDGEKIIFTIYDWKDRTPFKKIRNWHIGSRGNPRHNDILKSFFQETVRNAKFELI